MSGLKRITWALLVALAHGIGRFLDVILHLGAHRTGTTSFQNYLNRNRDNLRQLGTEYWGPHHTRSKLFSGLFRHPGDVDDKATRLGRRSSSEIVQRLNEFQQAGVNSLIVSEENMIGVMKDNLTAAQLYPDLRARLGWVTQGFQAHCNRVVLTIRSYDSYWESVLAFTTSRAWPVPNGDERRLLLEQPRRWRHVISDIAGVLPGAEIIVWPFEAFAGHAQQQLTMVTGGTSPLSWSGANIWRNASPDCAQLRKLLMARGDIADAARLPDMPTRWRPFSKPQITQFQQNYAEDIAWLRAGAEGKAIFIENTDSEPLKAQSWAQTGERGQTNGQQERHVV